jgi:hypothetical protein
MSNDSIMARLRRANPVPATPALENSALFARIVASPADPRLANGLSAHLSSRRRRVLIAAIAAGVAALLASTAFAVSQLLGGDVVKPVVTRQEYLAAQKQLVLPPGATWPEFNRPESNSVTSRGAGGGRAVLVAMNAWECYWVAAMERGDATAGREAHAQLDKLLANNVLEAPAGASENWTPTPLPTHPFVAFAHDGGLDWIRNNYVQAAAGHPAGLAQSCRANR